MMRKLLDLDLGGKTVFVRVDFNVPIQDGRLGEPHRIDSALPTIRHILDRAKKIVLASHLGRPEGKRSEKYSLAPVREYLQERLANRSHRPRTASARKSSASCATKDSGSFFWRISAFTKRKKKTTKAFPARWRRSPMFTW